MFWEQCFVLCATCEMLLNTQREKCPYSEFFWSVFFRIRTEYGDLLRKYSYSVQMRENTDQKNFECGYFLRSDERMCNGKLLQSKWITLFYMHKYKKMKNPQVCCSTLVLQYPLQHIGRKKTMLQIKNH